MTHQVAKVCFVHFCWTFTGSRCVVGNETLPLPGCVTVKSHRLSHSNLHPRCKPCVSVQIPGCGRRWSWTMDANRGLRSYQLSTRDGAGRTVRLDLGTATNTRPQYQTFVAAQGPERPHRQGKAGPFGVQLVIQTDSQLLVGQLTWAGRSKRPTCAVGGRGGGPTEGLRPGPARRSTRRDRPHPGH